MTTSSNSDASATVGVPLIQNVPVSVDTKGRVRATREQRRAILAEFERRGLSAARFAKLTGLKYSTFSAWLRRYRRPKYQGEATGSTMEYWGCGGTHLRHHHPLVVKRPAEPAGDSRPGSSRLGRLWFARWKRHADFSEV